MHDTFSLSDSSPQPLAPEDPLYARLQGLATAALAQALQGLENGDWAVLGLPWFQIAFTQPWATQRGRTISPAPTG